MANDWLKINVNGQGWGTTGSGPLGTTPVQISAGTCDETIARSATIVFKAGSLTKRLKVTQGIAASPTIQLTPSLMTIGKTQTSQVALTVSNVDELTGWYWVVTPSGANGVEVRYNNQVKTSSFSGTVTTVAASNLTVTNKTATSGNFTLKAELFTSEGRLLSTNTKSFVLTGDPNPEPVITIIYTGSIMQLHSGSTETVQVQVSNIPSNARGYTWNINFTNGYQGVTANPPSGNTNNVYVGITNNSRTSGGDSFNASVTVTYADGTQKTSASNTIQITFLPVDYNYRLVIDTQPSATLNYQAQTSVKFHVEDTHGNPLTETNLTWTLVLTSPWMDQVISRTPTNGNFADSGYTGECKFTNVSVAWAETGVSMTLNLLRDGVIIDSIVNTTDLNRYINNITLKPRPILQIKSPAPDAGGNVPKIELPYIGGTLEVSFVANMPWTTWFDVSDIGFTIESGPSSGPACSDSTDIRTLILRYPRNTSTTTTIPNNFRISIDGLSHYVSLQVNEKEPLYIELTDLDGQTNWMLGSNADYVRTAPISANVTTFIPVFESIEYGTSCPDWLSVTTRPISSPRPNINYEMVVRTLSANTGTEERPAGSITIGLKTVDEYAIPPEPSEIFSNTINVKQAPQSTDIVSVKLDGTIIWTNDPQDPSHQGTDITVPYGGWPDGKVMTVARRATGGETVLSTIFTWRTRPDTSDFYIKHPNQGGGASEWSDNLENPFSASKGLLVMRANSTYIVRYMEVDLTEEQGEKFIVSLSFNQAAAPIINPSSFEVSWNLVKNSTVFTITATAGSNGVPAPALFHIYISRNGETRNIEIPMNDGNALGPNAGKTVTYEYDDLSDKSGQMWFGFDNSTTEENKITLPSREGHVRYPTT